MTSKLDAALVAAQANVPECIAAGYVDMSTGMFLGVRTVDLHSREILDLLAAATAELFQGQNVTAIEELFKRARGVSNTTRYFEEIMVLSQNLLHVFLRSRRHPEHAVVFVCRKSVNLGMAMARTRLAMSSIELAV